MRKIKLYWPFIIPIAVLVVAGIYWQKGKTSPAPNMIVGLIQTDYFDAASEIPGRMKSVLVEEGDTVEQGEVIALLEPTSSEAIQAESRAALDAAEAQLDLVKNGAREEDMRLAENTYQIALEQYKLAKATWERINALYKDSVVAAEENDLAYFKFQAAKREKSSAYQHLKKLRKGAREESIRIAEAVRDEAENANVFISTLTTNREIRAPHSGIVSAQMIEEEEVVLTASPLFTIMDTESFKAVVSVRQDLMGQFKMGSRLMGRVPGMDHDVEFEVVKRDVQLSFADWLPTNQKGEFDLRTFEVELEPVSDSEGLIPGMTVGFNLE